MAEPKDIHEVLLVLDATSRILVSSRIR